MKKKKNTWECFYSSVKGGATGDSGEKLDGHIVIKIIWCATKFGMNLT